MKNIFKLVKKSMTLACVFSLLNTSAVLMAETEHSSDQGWVGAALGVLNGAKDTLKQGYDARRQTQRALQMRRQMAQFLGQPATTRAKFFEHCVLPAAISNFPENACQNINHPSEVALAKEFLRVSQGYKKMYEAAMTPAQNTRNPRALMLKFMNFFGNILMIM